jgi:hypothetical protein
MWVFSNCLGQNSHSHEPHTLSVVWKVRGALYTLLEIPSGASSAQMSGLAIEHACPAGDVSAASKFERASGCLAATIFSVTYVAVPLCILSIPLLLFFQPYWWVTWIIVVPFVLSAIAPPVPSRSFLQTWPFKHMPKYFNYSEIKEISDEDIQTLIGSRGVIFAVQPHGVFSFGGASAGVSWAKRWWHPKSIPTAVAASVSALPFIKHIVGLFGICEYETHKEPAHGTHVCPRQWHAHNA